MSLPLERVDYMSTPAKLFYWLGLPIPLATILILQPWRGAISSVFTAVPVILLLYQRSRLAPQDRGQLEHLVWIFFASGTLGVAAATSISVLLSIAFGSLWGFYALGVKDFLSGFDSAITNLLPTPQMFSLAVYSFGVISLPEELIKYLAVRFAVVAGNTFVGTHEFANYAVASALGIRTFWNLVDISRCPNSDSLSNLILTGLGRMLLYDPISCLMAVLSAVRMARRETSGKQMSWWWSIGPSVFYHGVFNFAMFALSGEDGEFGSVHPKQLSNVGVMVAVAATVLVMLIMHVRAEWAS